MTFLVTGGDGQLGRALGALLPDAVLLDRGDLDITDRAALAARDWSGTTAIVNAAAWTAVDAAERDDDLLAAWDVNVTGVANLAAHARRLDVPLVHVSSDYVLRGDHTGEAGVDAPVDPLGAYGTGKAASELAARLAPRHYVVRTSWVFGDGPNFVRTMRRLAAERDEVRVVDDQHGRPTSATDLAAAIAGLVERSAPSGVYHATGSGDVVSWAGFAAQVLAGSACAVVPVTSAEHAATAAVAPAPRPVNSTLSLAALAAVGIEMRDWRTALAEHLEEGA